MGTGLFHFMWGKLPSIYSLFGVNCRQQGLMESRADGQTPGGVNPAVPARAPRLLYFFAAVTGLSLPEPRQAVCGHVSEVAYLH